MSTGSKTLILATILFATSALEGRTRAVRPLPEVVYNGRIADEATGKPVIAAEVTSGNRTVRTNVTGAFAIIIPAGRPTALVIERSGYEDLTVTVNATIESAGGVVSPMPPPTATPAPTIVMKSKAPIVVKKTNGATLKLDADSVEFAYIIPFSSPATSTAASFCKMDGTAFTPDRTELAKFIGPVVKAANSACCKFGPMLAADVEMKDGSKEHVFFSDSCFGYDVVFYGREHESAEFVYTNFVDVLSIEFP